MKIKINNIFKLSNESGSDNKVKRRKIIDVPIVEDDKENDDEKNGEVKRRRRTNNKFISLKEDFNNLIFNKNHFSRGTYALLFVMFVLAITSVTFTIQSYKALNEENYNTFTSQDNVQAISNSYIEEVEIEEQDPSTNNNDVQEEINKEDNINSVDTSADENIQERVIQTLDFESPLSGNILKIYSVDKVIYSKTLDMWKTHDGIDIEGKMGEAVYASERGVVEKIFNDSFLGMTVVISHIANYKTSYSNLSEDVPVKVGDQVKKGQRIGNISDTSIGEIKDNPHLHFMVFKNNETIDPSSILD